MRHSLFFYTFADADKAQAKLNAEVVNLLESYQSNDGETGVIEVRFFTDALLDEFTQRSLQRVTHPVTSALNCEE